MSNSAEHQRQGGSFRDPGGFLYLRDGTLYRQVNEPCRESYDRLMGSGLYDRLIERNSLIPHQEMDLSLACDERACKVLRPERVAFISYPYEWCFSQLRDAALATLEIQRQAMEFGLSLKDASAYNIQFHGGRPTLIDTLSFEVYREGSPWVAYRQFCQHFLAPLALMARVDIRLRRLLRVFIDGIPLDLASRLLGRLWLAPRLWLHVRLHAGSQKKYEDRPTGGRQGRFGRLAFLGLIESLQAAVRGLRWRPAGTQWGEYYSFTNYSDQAMQHKMELVGRFLGPCEGQTVWDLGANTGAFSRLASQAGAYTMAFDVDPAAVEKNYIESVRQGESNLLPLLLDLTNPSPSLGWASQERDSLLARGPADTILALALVHHLAIGNNVPLDRIADFLGDSCRRLIIEFVPKGDSQVDKLLASREDVFDEYHQAGFESAFARRFEFAPPEPIEGSSRLLYRMTVRGAGGAVA